MADPLIGDLRRAGLLPLLVLHFASAAPAYGNQLIERIADAMLVGRGMVLERRLRVLLARERLARHDLELHLVDSRAAQVEPERIAALTADAVAGVHRHHSPVPELVLGELPAGSHVLIMTHDHAEDAALCDTALRCGHLASIGLIGSSAKWRRFEKKLAAEGHGPEDLARITTPIGLPEITGKDPAAIAVGVAADLLVRFSQIQEVLS